MSYYLLRVTDYWKNELSLVLCVQKNVYVLFQEREEYVNVYHFDPQNNNI